MSNLMDLLQELGEEEQKQVEEFIRQLLKEKSYEQKIAALKNATHDHVFQKDMQTVSEDFSAVDFE